MPKCHSIDAAVLAVLCAVFMPQMLAQSTSGPSPSNDPKALLLAAADVNSAPGADAKPWHAKISFTLNDWYGKPETQGTIEEFWAAPDKIKLVYATTSFNQVEYTTPAGIRRTGSRDGAPPELTLVIDKFLRPIDLDPSSADATKLKLQPLKSSSAKLVCVSAFRPRSAGSPGLDEVYCMNDSLPVLRVVSSSNGFQRSIRNSIVRFQNHYFPQQIEDDWGIQGEKPTQHLVARLEALEFLSPADEAALTPPAEAVSPPQVITLDEKTAKLQLLEKTVPVYPPIAKAARVSGDVVLSIQIQTDGSVEHLRVVSGPPMLIQATLDGVKKWKYRPFTQNGEPVEVNTTVTVPFRISE